MEDNIQDLMTNDLKSEKPQMYKAKEKGFQ
jgi:hypothetical protein